MKSLSFAVLRSCKSTVKHLEGDCEKKGKCAAGLCLDYSSLRQFHGRTNLSICVRASLLKASILSCCRMTASKAAGPSCTRTGKKGYIKREVETKTNQSACRMQNAAGLLAPLAVCIVRTAKVHTCPLWSHKRPLSVMLRKSESVICSRGVKFCMFVCTRWCARGVSSEPRRN